MGTAAQTTSYPKGVQLAQEELLLVSDISISSRIIMYPPTPPSSPFGLSAIDIFGQTTFTSKTHGLPLTNSKILIRFADDSIRMPMS